jgi:hypothetical protein
MYAEVGARVMCAVVAATRAFARSMIRGKADVGGRRAEEECRTRSSFDRFLLRLRLSFVDDARFTISACLLIQARLVRTTMVGTTDCWRSGLPSAAHGAASAGCAASRVRSSRSHADNARGSTRDALLARQGRRPSTPPFDDAARSTTGRDRPSRASSAGGPPICSVCARRFCACREKPIVAPVLPGAEDCCQSSPQCKFCVWTVYEDDLAKYRRHLSAKEEKKAAEEGTAA